MLSVDPDIRRLMALRAGESGLLRLKWLAAATRFELAMLRYDRALKLALKAGFDPNQPRVPRGNPDGGQWTSGGGGSSGTGPSNRSPRSGKTPEPPDDRPPKSRDRMATVKAVARRVLQTGETVAAAAKAGAWLRTYSAEIASYNDPPKSLEELQRAASTRAPGYDIHHIVEQTHAERDGFTRRIIDSPDNLVRVPRLKHQDINAWYQTKNKDYGGLSPREYLSGRNWEVRRAVGLRALRIHGVLK